MKKLMLFILLGIFVSSCSTDDDVPNIEYGLASITNSEFPGYFEAGKSYDIKLTYKLPSSCHTFLGFDGGREDDSTQEFFIYALTSRNLDLTDCNTDDASLTKQGTIRNFMISENVSDDEVFIFKLWTGNDSEDNPIYETIEVPVGEPDIEPAS
ncbi:hypothetical protein G3I01_05210 [Gramella sp. MT6]|uniref:hypothetical protein n=1 Tax=Gramella sp. MT6 TaxID=2705471 RepID=UPI001C5CE711|nr:hypothetical protein [Gramella sp. MT6]QYA24932.1 hypothetical protein G3I01_05210 [Gramella sp. MT6]